MEVVFGVHQEGLHQAQADHLLRHRKSRPFASLEDVVERSQLREDTLLRLAESGAFEGFGYSRRESLWQTKGAFKNRGLELFTEQGPTDEALPQFVPLDDFERVQWDYRTSHHSSRGHPIAGLREALRRKRILSSQELNELRDGAWANYAGLVICRQRPGTAGGVVFMTLEDELGFVNVVIWQKVFERFRTVGKTCNFLGISGRVQSQHTVVHLIAEKLWEPDIKIKPEKTRSRGLH